MLNRYLPGILSLFPEKKIKHVTVVVTPAVYIPHEGDVFILERRGTSWVLNEECNEWVLGGRGSDWVLTRSESC